MSDLWAVGDSSSLSLESGAVGNFTFIVSDLRAVGDFSFAIRVRGHW